MNIIEKYQGIILGGCYGDVLGSQTENMTRAEILKKFGSVTTMNPNKFYTDDSEMTLAILKNVICNKRIDKDKVHFSYADEIVNTIKTKGHIKGYSSKTRSIIEKIKFFQDKKESVNLPIGRSPNNGAVMRISPLILLNHKTDDDLIKDIVSATYYTHGGNSDAVYAAYVHCKLLKQLLYMDINNFNVSMFILFALNFSVNNETLFAKMHLLKFLLEQKITPDAFSYNMFGKTDFFQIRAIDCLVTAIYIFCYYANDPVKTVCTACEIGGDTDTIAKLAGEYAGALHGNKWFPAEWKGIENENVFIDLVNQHQTVNFC